MGVMVIIIVYTEPRYFKIKCRVVSIMTKSNEMSKTTNLESQIKVQIPMPGMGMGYEISDRDQE